MMRSASTKRERVGQSVSRGILLAHPANYAREVLADAPTAFYKCQDAAGVKPVDASGNGSDMTTQAGTAFWRGTGPFNFGEDASRRPPDDPRSPGDYAIILPQFRRNTVTSVTNNWTMECWVLQQGAFSDVGIIMGNGDGLFGGGASVGYDLFWSGTGGKFQVGYRGVAVNSDSTISCVSNTWYHIVVCRD